MSKRMSWITLVILLVASLVLAACAQPPAPTQAPAPAKTEAPAPAKTEAPAPAKTEAPAATEAPVVTEAPAAGEPVTLTFGNWRPDDVKQMQVILDEFNKAYPNIIIKFDPTNPPDYDAAVRTQMESGTGADLYYLRSSGASHKLYDEGHFVAIDDLPGLDNIIPEAIKTWTAADGKVFGVGYIATSEGIYYNKDIFTELGIAIPTSWEELITASQAIKDAGYIPFANASGDSWTIGTLLLQNWIPTVIGGVDGRLATFAGEKCLNDTDWVQAFKQVQDMAAFLPEGWEALTYYDSQQLFLQSKAAMWLGGSWDIPAFELEQPDFKWGIMAVPPANEKPLNVEFELDAGVGINSATQHLEEAKTFMTWLTTKQSAELLANNLPGFFPMTKDQITTDNAYANEFLAIKAGASGSDIRFYMSEGVPDSTTLLIDNGIAVLKGDMTPEEAAQSLYDGIASWNDAQKNCKP
jgi:raffinose/stachyose/melibiose transport system substrate-binding protein